MSDIIEDLTKEKSAEYELQIRTSMNHSKDFVRRCHHCKKMIKYKQNVHKLRKNDTYIFCIDTKCAKKYLVLKLLESERVIAKARKVDTCAQCGKLIEIGSYYWRTTEKKMCSQDCRDAWNADHQRSRTFGTGTCKYVECGKEFQKQVPNQEYCCPGHYRKQSEVGKLKKNKPKEDSKSLDSFW